MTNFLRNSFLGVGLSFLALTGTNSVAEAHEHGTKTKPVHQCEQMEGMKLFNSVPYEVEMGKANLGTFCLYKSDTNKRFIRAILPFPEGMGFYYITDELPYDYVEYWINCSHFKEKPVSPFVIHDRKADRVIEKNPYTGKTTDINNLEGFARKGIFYSLQPICRGDWEWAFR